MRILGHGEAKQVGIYMPCYVIFRNSMEDFTTNNSPTLTQYVPLIAVTFALSLACITCYPVELARTRMQYRTTASYGLDLVQSLLVMFLSLQSVGRHLSHIEAGAGSTLGPNFAAGFGAGSIAAAITCPLDVVKTQRQLEGWRGCLLDLVLVLVAPVPPWGSSSHPMKL
ncbi:hypothetical protein V6N12_059290 [Hibiscus sabdariffa]|uniref:Uncharacterized protein n=1 Tax=Hibiscus sabdariffa TaxID=183260 RepID=A0ABR2EUL7_9ROSI